MESLTRVPRLWVFWAQVVQLNKQKLTSRISRMRSLEDLRLVNCNVVDRERGAGEAAFVATDMV